MAKESLTLEQQAQQLTQAQKETVLKVDKWGTLLLLLLAIPGLILMLLGMYAMGGDGVLFAEKSYEGFQTAGVILMALSLGVFLFIKIKFPYYSNKLATYLRSKPLPPETTGDQ